MNKKYIVLPSFILALVVYMFWLSSASACGCGVLITSHNDGSWAYGDDSTEQSFINLDKGTEKLIISLDIRNTSKDSVLVIPVPAQPTTVKADVLSETPNIYGYDVESKAQENISNIRDVLLLTQIYPVVPLVLWKNMQGLENIGSGFANDKMTNAPGSQGVIVYQHLEKNGMIAEVLSASNSDSLYNYLTEKGLKVEKDSIPVFRDYINNNFSFIVSWINPSAVGGNARGILATFPSDKMYYPLKPGSAYSGNGTTKTITVIGNVTPELYSDIKTGTTINYYYSDSGLSSKDFFSSDVGFGFTKITINVEPAKLTQDLYISSNTPLRIYNAQLINLHPVVYGFILLLIISALSTYIVTSMLYSSTLTRSKLLGLTVANCFTLIGTIIGSRIYLQNKKSKYVILTSLSFVFVTLLIWYLIFILYQHSVIPMYKIPMYNPPIVP